MPPSGQKKATGKWQKPSVLAGEGITGPSKKTPPEAQSQNKTRQEQQTGQRPAVAHALTPVSTVTSCRIKMNLV